MHADEKAKKATERDRTLFLEFSDAGNRPRLKYRLTEEFSNEVYKRIRRTVIEVRNSDCNWIV